MIVGKGIAMKQNNVVGYVLAQYRMKKGLSQEVLSGLAGIARTHLSMIENGSRKPTLDTFFRLCNSLGVKPSEVMKEIEKQAQM